jgi:hypothetical protein
MFYSQHIFSLSGLCDFSSNNNFFEPIMCWIRRVLIFVAVKKVSIQKFLYEEAASLFFKKVALFEKRMASCF